MFRKKYILVLLIAVLCTVSAVNASEINQTDIDNDILEDTQEDVKLQTSNDIQEISNQNDDALKTSDLEEQVLAAESKDVLKSDSSPIHVNLETSQKTVTCGKLQHIRVKVTDDDGNPLENVFVAFKIYKNGKIVDTQDEWGTGKDGYVYYCTDSLNPGTYNVKYSIVDKNLYTAGVATSKLTVKKIKLSMKVKRSTGEILIFLKKNKKPINKVKLKVKIYTGKKYKTIYLKSGYNKKISKYKGFCAFATNDLKVGKHKVVITSANKKYDVSKTTSIKVTKSI